MRIVGHIPHPNITITVFHMNDKYIIKFEAGPMEQVYKVPQSEVKGMEDVQKIVNDDFLKKILDRFNEMFLNLQEAKKIIQS